MGNKIHVRNQTQTRKNNKRFLTQVSAIAHVPSILPERPAGGIVDDVSEELPKPVKIEPLNVIQKSGKVTNSPHSQSPVFQVENTSPPESGPSTPRKTRRGTK